MAEQLKNRNEIDAKYKWDLTHIFPNDEAWQAAYDQAMAAVSRVAALDGHVAENPGKAIREVYAFQEEFMPVMEYAFLRKETDNTDPVAQGLKDQAIRLAVTSGAASAFL